MSFSKDHKVVTFYTNQLAGTPRQDVEGLSDHTFNFTYGLELLRRLI